MPRRFGLGASPFDRAQPLRRAAWMVSMALCAACFSEDSSSSGGGAMGPSTSGAETSTSAPDDVGTVADTSTISTTIATTDESTSAGSTTGDGTGDSSSGSVGRCPELIETFDACPNAPWEASDADLVACSGGDAVLTVTSADDGNVTLMLPVGLTGATAVVELGDPPPPEIVKVLRVRTSNAEVIAFRSSGATSALEIIVASGDAQDVLATAPYDAEAHRWLSLREEDGWLYFETSADGVDFTPFHATATQFDVSETTVGIAAGNSDPIGQDTPVSFGHFEYCSVDPA